MLKLLAVLFLVVVLLHALLWFAQDRLLYFPANYVIEPEELPAPLTTLRYPTSQGPQVAVMRPARSGKESRLWVVHGGNAMVALGWIRWAESDQDPDAAYLLIDYPGYGFNSGNPGREAIVEASQAALAALAAQRGITADALAARACYLGHSLGAAATLELSVRLPPRGIVLTAPFLSLRSVARAHYGPTVAPLVRDRFDNGARVGELAALVPRPRLVVLHGDRDEVIPFEQGEALAERAPWARFVAVPGAGHNDLYDRAEVPIRAAMREVCEGG